MYNAVFAAIMVFILVYGGMRLAEKLYHRVRLTPDWSPHWGSWLFAVLLGVYVLVTELGRSV